jgi:hypothetical protein
MFFGAGIDQQLIGNNPVIPDKVTVDDNLPMQHDFKSVYASVLRQWFQASDEVVKTVIPGDFPTLHIFKS